MSRTRICLLLVGVLTGASLANSGTARAQGVSRAIALEKTDSSEVEVRPYAIFVANAAYNTHALVPGNIAFFSVPEVEGITARQFSISAGNTLVGVDVVGSKVGSWALNGKLDFNLRGPTPVTEDNVFAPYFANVYIELKSDRHRVLAGLAADFVSPLSPRSLNLYPGSYLPGDLGTNRPQVRYEYSRPAAETTTFTVQVAAATAVQTFQVSDEVLGFGTDIPDGQLRPALRHEASSGGDRASSVQLGVSGHVGRRRRARIATLTERDFTTWSGSLELAADVGKFRISGEAFSGSILGDYKGGILHTFNPILDTGIRAVGGWAQLQYRLDSKLSLAGGYGLDDTADEDLSAGFRSHNDVIQGNVFYNVSRRLTVGLDVSRWRTDWVNLPGGRVVRIEPALFYVFQA